MYIYVIVCVWGCVSHPRLAHVRRWTLKAPLITPSSDFLGLPHAVIFSAPYKEFWPRSKEDPQRCTKELPHGKQSIFLGQSANPRKSNCW